MILVACEESQAVTIAFRDLGFEAYSCDIIPCSGGHPEWHIQDDVLMHINDGWELMIAHPPCTYLSVAGAARLYPQKGVIDQDRYLKGLSAKAFFMELLNADIDHIAVENPTPLTVFDLPPCSQVIQPYEYGHPYSKRTCLWLKNLPNLEPTNIITDNITSWVNGGSKDHNGNKRNNVGLKSSQLLRSKTFDGIARAMAEQWSKELYA